MSRTDKDRPRWVTAQWWQPYHMCREFHSRVWQKFDVPCDLAAEPVRRRTERSRWRYTGPRPLCIWVAVWDRYQVGNPPRDLIHAEWHGPQRRAVRDDSREAIAQYRATGDVDIVHETRQARHGVAAYYNY